jgi:multidrug efflux pump subunit AcrA (membrane-fusion protein)
MKRRAALLALAALVLAGCPGGEKPKGKAEAPAVPGVKVQAAELRPIVETLEAVGTVRAERQSVLASKILARVTAVQAREGERVRAGQLLVELDDKDVQAQLRQAGASLRESQNALEENEKAIRASESEIGAALAEQELARSTAERYRRLFEQKTVSRQQHDEALAKFKASSALVTRARELRNSLLAKRQRLSARIEFDKEGVVNARVLVGHTRIAAPFDGIVVTKAAEAGNVASPGAPLLTLEDEQYRLELSVPESEISKVRLGEEVAVEVGAILRGAAGKVTEIVPAADPVSRTSTVKISLPPTAGLRSGLYGKVRFGTGRREVLLVPPGAIVERGQLEGLFVVDEKNVARLRLVKTGKVREGMREILAGLTPGERIAVEGVARLSDGSRVETAE